MSEKEKGEKGEKGDKEGRLAEILKKVMNTGVGAAFLTEDAIKGLLSDLSLSLPKEILNNLLQGAKSTKEDFLNSVKGGVKEYFHQLDFRRELGKVLENYDFEIHAKISLKKKPATAKEKE